MDYYTLSPILRLMLTLFKDRNFFRYFLGDSFAKIADSYFFIFLTWVALQQTGSPLYAGALLMANGLPRLIFMLFGGVLADRIAPQVILRLGNIVQALGLVAILVGLWFGGVPIGVLFAIAIIFGTIDAFSAPASISAIPRIVPRSKLLQANSAIQGVEMVTFVLGTLITGIVLQTGNLELATIINIALYLTATTLFFTVKLKFKVDKTVATENQFKLIKEGLHYVWKKPVLRANTLLLAATNIAVSGPISIGFLLLVTSKLELGPIYYTLIFVGFGFGTITGAILAGTRKRVKGPGRLLIANYILNGLGFVGIAFVTDIWVLVAASAVLGVLGGFAGAINATWTQLNTRKNMLGRVGAITMVAALAFDPFSSGISGAVAEWSIDGLFIVSGLFIIVATLLVIPFNRILLSGAELKLK